MLLLVSSCDLSPVLLISCAMCSDITRELLSNSETCMYKYKYSVLAHMSFV
jgi:hypothetical protein